MWLSTFFEVLLTPSQYSLDHCVFEYMLHCSVVCNQSFDNNHYEKFEIYTSGLETVSTLIIMITCTYIFAETVKFEIQLTISYIVFDFVYHNK